MSSSGFCRFEHLGLWVKVAIVVHPNLEHFLSPETAARQASEATLEENDGKQ